MSAPESTYIVDELLEPGMRYREELGHDVHTLPKRFCGLWLDDVEGPVSDIDVISVRQRFGKIVVDAEGLGGVETLPEYRQRGYVRKVIVKALEKMADRVSVAFIPEGIELMYEKFGFGPCLADGYLTVPVRQVERELGHLTRKTSNYSLRLYQPNDLPTMIRLFNTAHSNRPWTLERQPNWNRIPAQQTWRPGSEVLVVEEADRLVGYAILPRNTFGKISRKYTIDELTAENIEVAQHLLAEISARCHRLCLSEFTVREPLDSLAGHVAQRLGCTYHQEFSGTGGLMGKILNRAALLQQLEPELRGRLADNNTTNQETSFALLQQGELIPDNTTLLRLLLGYWSLSDAQIDGTVIPEIHQQVCQGWFPGGNTPYLQMPYAHWLDRY